MSKAIENLLKMDKICDKYKYCSKECKIHDLCGKYCGERIPFEILKDLEDEIIEMEEEE